MSIIAIITARGGSKRIPKKNIKDFCGKPIITYSIEAALNAGIFDEVMVSTDSREIANIADRYGAKTPFFRSASTSSDYAVTADVVTEVLKRYREIGRNFDYFVCIYPTAPFITKDKLIDAVAILEKKKADAVISVVQYSFPPQRAFKIKEDKLAYIYPEYECIRSQDLEPIYHDCGQFYMCKSSTFLKYHSLVLPNTVPYIIPDEEVQDIDTISDWKIAEVKYSVLHNGG